MKPTPEVLNERERIKDLYNKMFNDLLEKKKKKVKKIRQQHISFSKLKYLEERFFWYIDNPDYKRTTTDGN